MDIEAVPIPKQSTADSPSRGVAVEGPVFSRRLARFRVFRYEVRRWRNGVIADADEAVASPQLLSNDPLLARRLLDRTCGRFCPRRCCRCSARSGGGELP